MRLNRNIRTRINAFQEIIQGKLPQDGIPTPQWEGVILAWCQHEPKKRLEKGEKRELWWSSYKGLAGGPKKIAPMSERMPKWNSKMLKWSFPALWCDDRITKDAMLHVVTLVPRDQTKPKNRTAFIDNKEQIDNVPIGASWCTWQKPHCHLQEEDQEPVQLWT